MIIVFGSINMDMNIALDHFPQTGETVLCHGYTLSRGGKGGNQALAALRMGAKVALVGTVGDDEAGRQAVHGLRRAGVITSGVAQSTFPTGYAVITRDSHGNNRVIVATGANEDATADQVPDEILIPGAVLLVQMELQPEETYTLISRAHERGVTTILNLSPVRSLPPAAILKKVDYLIVNEIEAAQTCALMKITVPEEPRAQARALSDSNKLVCIVTAGSQGAFAALPDGRDLSTPALDMDEVIDTTGAGDCYCGTLAAALENNIPLPEAMKYAATAASLACRTEGTQKSYPYRADIDEYLPALGPLAST